MNQVFKLITMMFFLILLFMTIPVTGFAEEYAGKAEEEKNEVELQDVVVSATRTETKIEHIADSVTVITAEEIEKKGHKMIYDVLRGVPGISVQHLGSPANWTYIRTRGGKETHTKVLINGMDFAIDPSGVDTDFGYLDAEDIERIEIVKGPQSSLYGSDAISGVINIITKKGKGKPKFYVKGEGGSMDMFRGSGGVNGGVKNINYNLNFSHDEGGGLFPHDEYKKEVVSGRFGYQFSENTSLDLHISYTDKWCNCPSTYNFKCYDDPRKFVQRYKFFSGIALNQKLISWWEHKLYYAYNHSKYNYDDPYDGVPSTMEPYKGSYGGSVNKISWQHNLYLGKIDTLTVGFEYDEDEGEVKAESPKWGDKEYEHTTDNKSYFLHNQIMFFDEALSFTCGGRLDDHSEFGDHTTYKLGLTYLFKDIGLKLKATHGTGFKAPSINNLYDLYGNPDLEPEESESWDVGFEQSFFQDRVVLETTYFHNEFENLIAFDYATYRYANIKTSETYGVEVGLNIYPRDDISVLFSYTFIDGEEDDEKELTRIPEDEWNVNVTYSPGKLRLSTDIYYVGGRPNYDREHYIDSYYRVDLAGSYQLKDWLEFFGRIENLFDEDYEEATGYRTPGCSAWVGVKLSY